MRTYLYKKTVSPNTKNVLWTDLKIYQKIGAWYVTEPSEPTLKANWWHEEN